LKIPRDLSGHVRIELEGFGDLYQGKPIARVSAVSRKSNAEPTPLGEVKFNKWPETRDLGVLNLPPDTERIRIAFPNDAYDANSKADRNLYVTSLTCWEVSPDADRTASVKNVHPRNGDVIGRTDAMVVDLRAVSRVAWVEAVINGEPTDLRFKVESGSPRVMVPLLLR
ncbi:unnamed protein product, partial [Ectocarpus fasciculatus]